MNGLGWLDYKEAATLVGLSEYTIRRYVSQGRIPSKRVGMKRRFFDREQLLQWVESTSKERPARRAKPKDDATTGNSNGTESQ